MDKSGMIRRILKFILGQRAAKVRPRVPEDMRIYAIGDIHGRCDLLDEIQAKMIFDAASAPNKTFVQIFLGDYVDRGFDTKGVVDWLLKPPPEGWKRVCLKGNHEAMLLRFLATPEIIADWRHFGGVETLHSYSVDLNYLQDKDAPEVLHEDFKAKLPETHHAFFSNLQLSAQYGDYFFAHAGIRPGRQLKAQKEEDLLWIRGDFLTSRLDFSKIVVHGHSVMEKPDFRPNRINIDTGAYLSGRLSCLVLDGEEQRIL